MRNAFRQLADVIGFSQLPRERRQIVFYSEGLNYWPHLEGLVKGVLADGSAHVCYVSSDRDDPGLALRHEHLSTFFVGTGFLRNWLFETLACDVMVMTMPDLANHQIKRSANCSHYAYVQHSPVSLHMIYRPGAFDHYDSIFCAGPHHVAEIRAMEQADGTPAKRAVEHGYARLEHMRERAADAPAPAGRPIALLAPSWGPDAIIEAGLGVGIVEHLLAKDHDVVVRPHPQTARLRPDRMKEIAQRFAGEARVRIEDNVAGTESLFASSLMVSDWSGAAIEYGLALGRPVVFVDVPRKVNDPDYGRIGLRPMEVALRERLGIVVPPDGFTLEGIDRVRLQKQADDVIYANADERGTTALMEIWREVAR